MSARLILIWIWIQQRWAMVNTPLVESLQGCGYEQREGVTRAFQLVRTIPASDDGPAIDIIIDFLRPRDAELVKNAPPLISNFAVQRADGADLALKFYEMVAISGAMPEGGKIQWK